MKNDNVHIFFFAVVIANFEVAGFTQKQKYTSWTVSKDTAKSRPSKNQSERTDLPKTGFAI